VEILPADTPPARHIALLHPIKHQKTLLICLFIGTAHWFAHELVFFAHRLQHCFTCPPLITVVYLLMRRSSAGAKLLRLLPALLL
jgi:hypothetical protein